MSLLRKVTLLLGCYDMKIQRQQRQLMQLESALSRLQQTVSSLETELQGMRALLKKMYPQGERLSRAALFALQRKQSVVRRRIANTELEAKQQHIDLSRCRQEIVQVQALRKQFLRQVDKYTRLQWGERVKRDAGQLRLEESEIEETLAWRK